MSRGTHYIKHRSQVSRGGTLVGVDHRGAPITPKSLVLTIVSQITVVQGCVCHINGPHGIRCTQGLEVYTEYHECKGWMLQVKNQETPQDT